MSIVSFTILQLDQLKWKLEIFLGISWETYEEKIFSYHGVRLSRF